MSVTVVYETLTSTAGSLEQAATALDGSGGSPPSGVDAGEMTSLVMSMMSAVTQSAGGLAEGLAAAGAGLRDSAAAYAGSDDSVAQRFDAPQGR